MQADWSKIRRHFTKSVLSNLHVSIATVDANNLPVNTPIGSLFLNKDQTGFYFEKFPSKLPLNAIDNKNICVLAVNSSLWFWIKSLSRLKFNNFPAIRLYGQLGAKRKATATELARFKRRTKPFKYFKGYNYLWGDMEDVREITFTRAEKINLGKMTKSL